MLEKQIERYGCKYAEANGVAAYKFTSPARRSVPDRIYLAPIPEWLRPIIAKYLRFGEFKQTGKKPTPPQEREHARLRSMGFVVEVIDNKDDARRVVDEMGDGA